MRVSVQDLSGNHPSITRITIPRIRIIGFVRGHGRMALQSDYLIFFGTEQTFGRYVRFKIKKTEVETSYLIHRETT